MHKLEMSVDVLRRHEDFGGVHLNKTQRRLRFDYLPTQKMYEINKSGNLLSLLDRINMKIVKTWDYNMFRPSDLINYFK